jgi:MFS family permease
MTNSPVIPDASGPAASDTMAWQNPRGGFLFFLALAAIGTGAAQLVPLVLTLALKATELTPDAATTTLSIVVGVASLFALIAFPLLGRLSDRVTWSGGRRRPFLFFGAALIAAGAVLQYIAPSVLVLLLGAVATLVGVSSSTVAFTSVIPDQIEPLRRGPSSAIVGLGLPVGALVGTFVAQLNQSSLAWQIFAPAALGVVGGLVLAIALKDKPIRADQRPRLGFSGVLGTFWTNPVRHPSFALAWFSRFLLFFGVAAVQAYQAFYLLMVLDFGTQEVGGAIFLSTLMVTGFALLFAPLSARISDRLGVRKPFVIVSALVFAIGLAVACFADSFPVFLVAMAIMGIGQGVYFAVDVALISEVLPDQANPAKDMGIFGLASSLPGSVVPAVAPALLLIGASAASPQNFVALFIAGAVAAVIGALLIIPIRGVR